MVRSSLLYGHPTYKISISVKSSGHGVSIAVLDLMLFDDLPLPKRGRSISGVHGPRAGTHDWITPREIVSALGEFDLDPCQSKTQPWLCARSGYVEPVDGLSEPWHGRVWLNPPYSVHASAWLSRLSRHGCGTALIFARTETSMFFEHVWPKASGLLFLEGRLHFHYPDGRRAPHNSGGPSVLIAYGDRDAEVLSSCGLSGAFVWGVSVR